MSHIATIKVEIKDLDALAATAAKLGMEFVKDQRSHKYYAEKRNPCDHLLRVKGNANAYEIGVVRVAGTNAFTLQWDNYQGGYGLTDKVGMKAEKLVQGYAAEVARRQALRQGFRVISESVRADGKVELVVAK